MKGHKASAIIYTTLFSLFTIVYASQVDPFSPSLSSLPFCDGQLLYIRSHLHSTHIFCFCSRRDSKTSAPPCGLELAARFLSTTERHPLPSLMNNTKKLLDWSQLAVDLPLVPSSSTSSFLELLYGHIMQTDTITLGINASVWHLSLSRETQQLEEEEAFCLESQSQGVPRLLHPQEYLIPAFLSGTPILSGSGFHRQLSLSIQMQTNAFPSDHLLPSELIFSFFQSIPHCVIIDPFELEVLRG